MNYLGSSNLQEYIRRNHTTTGIINTHTHTHTHTHTFTKRGGGKKIHVVFPHLTKRAETEEKYGMSSDYEIVEATTGWMDEWMDRWMDGWSGAAGRLVTGCLLGLSLHLPHYTSSPFTITSSLLLLLLLLHIEE